MINKLSDLAGFLEDQSIPAWVKESLREHRAEIFVALERGDSYTLHGPEGASITIAPKASTAAA
jgi:hypothetical protein